MLLPVSYHHSNHQYLIVIGAIRQGHQGHELYLQYQNVANPPAWEFEVYTKLMPLWENGQPADNSLGYFNSAVLRETPLHIYHNYAHYTLVKTSRLKLKMTSLLYHTTASLDSLHTTVLTTPMQPMNYITNRKSTITLGNVLIYITCTIMSTLNFNLSATCYIKSDLVPMKARDRSTPRSPLTTPYLLSILTTCKELLNW